jgi:hypothetical protein
MAASSIVLKAGRWKYKTTTDDPLFANIVGAMVEDGMKLDDELVIEGVLGEELEKKWECIEVLKDWMSWGSVCNMLLSSCQYVPEPPVITRGIMYVPAIPQPSITPLSLANRIQLATNESNVRTSDALAIRNRLTTLPTPPSRVLYRHEIQVLANALVLPAGWEAYTAIDEHSSDNEHIYHMKASLEFFRANLESDNYQLSFLEGPVQDLYNRTNDPNRTEGSLLAPFIRNLWLRAKCDKITMAHLLSYLNWATVLTILEPYREHDRIAGLVSIAEAMTGNVKNKSSYGVLLIKNMAIGIGVGKTYNAAHPLYPSLLQSIYERILSHLPDDVEPSVLGLDIILDKKVKAWASPPSDPLILVRQYNSVNISVSNIVGAVNASIITHLRWYKNALQRSLPNNTLYHSISDSIRVPRHHFPKVVCFLGETVGLYAMRRMLICLLYSISRISNIKTKVKKGQDKLNLELERAELFCELLEAYLSEHEGEDEGVITFELGKTKMVKNLANYYD